MKKKGVTGIAMLLIFAVLLNGCGAKKTEQHPEQFSEQNSEQNSEQHPEQSDYDAQCIEEAKSIARQGVLPKEERYIAYYMQEGGTGILLVQCAGGRDASGWEYTQILRTRDGGKNWEINPDIFIINRGTVRLYAEGAEVVLVDYGEKSMRGAVRYSTDYGQTFKTCEFSESPQEVMGENSRLTEILQSHFSENGA